MTVPNAASPIGIAGPGGFRLALGVCSADSRADGESLAVVVLQLDSEIGAGADRTSLGMAQLAKRLRIAVGRYALVARLSESRFAVLKREISLSQATALAERLRVAMELHFNGRGRSMTVSAGVACGPLSGERTTDQLLALAASRCVRARAAGGNRSACGGWHARPRAR
jgi:predicted signal transduction protein with EAL and GGDEF domain